MRVVHLLRKYDPAEWGGTETAVNGLIEGLRNQAITQLLYCPRLGGAEDRCAPARDDCAIRRFKSHVPVWGISRQCRQQFVAVGGNLMSFDLLPMLWREPDVDVIHTHVLGRLGGIAALAARRRKLPLVVSIHGGLLALPARLRHELNSTTHGGVEWGRIFGLLLRSRQLLSHADAVLACNPEEARLLREQHPRARVQVQPHGVPTSLYRVDHRAAAREAFPQIRGKKLLLCVGRIDPVKNQQWLLRQAPEIFRKHPETILLFAGPCTDESYGHALGRCVEEAGLSDRVFRSGALPSADPRLIGLYQAAEAVLLPSQSESFGLVLLEAWAAGSVVISSRTAGALALIKHGENGWLFDLEKPGDFQTAVDNVLNHPAQREQMAAAGRQFATAEYDLAAVAAQVKRLYGELREAKHALRNSAR